MHIVKKDPSLGTEFFKLAESLYTFMQEKFKFECEPKIFFHSDESNAENILGKTGYYDPQKEEVHLFITNRHPKDILRSFAHELTHHIQGCEGMADQDKLHNTSNPNYLIHDEYLKGLEADAFERGNIAFREWEAYVKEGKIKMDKNLDEKKKKKGKIPKKKLSKYKTLVRKIADDIKKSNPDIPDPIKFGTAANQAKKKLKIYKENEPMTESKKPEVQPEVVVNDSLKNSLTYQPDERLLKDAFNKREEEVYQELLRKFKIGKK
jgi:hypothetical protein